jgi:two-component system chemotaxis response regulator CheY
MPKILVVDDSRIVLSLHSYILGSAGFDCVTAENGFLALETLFRDRFDLVVTDVNMPRMDGYELTRRIRQTPGFTQIPIIIISTEEEAADKMKGMAAGANVYVVKPAEPASLIQNAKMLLSQPPERVHVG